MQVGQRIKFVNEDGSTFYAPVEAWYRVAPQAEITSKGAQRLYDARQIVRWTLMAAVLIAAFSALIVLGIGLAYS